MIFEISNPSDYCTLEAEDFRSAVVACICLGNGNYGLNHDDPKNDMPPMPFGGTEEWIKGEFDQGMEEFLKSVPKLQVAHILDSVILGDRKLYGIAIKRITEDQREEFKEEWQDQNTSNLNNIARTAKRLAEHLRVKFGGEGEANGVSTPKTTD